MFDVKILHVEETPVEDAGRGRWQVFVSDHEIRRSLHEARVESLRRSMAAASRPGPRRRPLRLFVGLRLISAGERLARSSAPSEAFAP